MRVTDGSSGTGVRVGGGSELPHFAPPLATTNPPFLAQGGGLAPGVCSQMMVDALQRTSPEDWPAQPESEPVYPVQGRGLLAPMQRVGVTPECGAQAAGAPSAPQASGHNAPVKGQGAAQKAGHHGGVVLGRQDVHAVLCGLQDVLPVRLLQLGAQRAHDLGHLRARKPRLGLRRGHAHTRGQSPVARVQGPRGGRLAEGRGGKSCEIRAPCCRRPRGQGSQSHIPHGKRRGPKRGLPGGGTETHTGVCRAEQDGKAPG